jgi:ribosomal-protein-alanine N-acetyltransferase
MNLEGLPYRLEPMTMAHVPTVAAIETAVFSRPWSLANFVHEVTDNLYSEYLVLRYTPWVEQDEDKRRGSAFLQNLFRKEKEDRSILGYGGLWLMVDEAHISTLAVRPAWRGRGLGEVLLAALIARGMARQAAYATLEVRRTNLVAQNLYRKYGFEYVGLRRGYYLDNNEDALIMTTAPLASEEYAAAFARLGASLRERLERADTTPPAAAASVSA